MRAFYCLAFVAAAVPAHAFADDAATRRVELAVCPIGPLVHIYEGGVSGAVSQHVALGASYGSLYRTNDDASHSISQVAVSAKLFVSRVYSGPFVEPGLIHRTDNYGAAYGSGQGYGGESWSGPELLVGWHYLADSGFTVSAAIGAGYVVADSKAMLANDEGAQLNGYLRMGYAF